MREIIIFDIDMTFGGTNDIIHPVVLCDDANSVLVDCGFYPYKKRGKRQSK